jgi:hypothetical protein
MSIELPEPLIALSKMAAMTFCALPGRRASFWALSLNFKAKNEYDGEDEDGASAKSSPERLSSMGVGVG